MTRPLQRRRAGQFVAKVINIEDPSCEPDHQKSRNVEAYTVVTDEPRRTRREFRSAEAPSQPAQALVRAFGSDLVRGLSRARRHRRWSNMRTNRLKRPRKPVVEATAEQFQNFLGISCSWPPSFRWR